MIKTEVISTCDSCGVVKKGYMNQFTLSHKLTGEGIFIDMILKNLQNVKLLNF